MSTLYMEIPRKNKIALCFQIYLEHAVNSTPIFEFDSTLAEEFTGWIFPTFKLEGTLIPYKCYNYYNNITYKQIYLQYNLKLTTNFQFNNYLCI